MSGAFELIAVLVKYQMTNLHVDISTEQNLFYLKVWHIIEFCLSYHFTPSSLHATQL